MFRKLHIIDMASILPIPPVYARDAYMLRAAAPSLVFVHVDWCPHCQNAKPVMEKVATALGFAVPVYGVDGDRNDHLTKSLGVQSYPTILFVDNDGIKKFEGERTFDNIIGFVCSNSVEGSFCQKK